jgi:hypothetical protein
MIENKKIRFPQDPLLGFVPAAFRWQDEPDNPPAPPKTVLQGDDIPEAFRGKPAKEIIDTLLTTATELEKFKTSLSEKDKEIENVRQEITRLREPPKSQLSEEELEAQREREFFQKPFKTIASQVEEKLKPLLSKYEEDKRTFQERLATTEEQNAKTRLKDYTKHEKRIKEYVNAVPVEFRSNPETWNTAWRLARSEDVDAREKEVNAKLGLHVEGTGTPGSEGRSKTQLDPDQKRVASQYGMTDEEYSKWSDNYYGD